MIKFTFIPHFAIRIVCAFVFFTAVGTLTHEFGHMAVAEYFGYETELHYGSIHYDYSEMKEDPLVLELKEIVKENADALKNEEYFDSEPRYIELLVILKEKYPHPTPHAFWVTLGGPAQTLLTSFLGLFILFYRRSKTKEHLVLMDWLGVFLALFALREIFNFVTVLFSTLLYGNVNSGNDEYRLSRYLDLNQWVIPTIAMIIGMTICLYVIFRVIPLKYRFTFIISGLVGGILGFFIWLRWLGPVVLP